jgi:hypothetical protein
VYHHQGGSEFQKEEQPPLDGAVERDQTTPLGWTQTNGRKSLLVGSSNYEDAGLRGGCVHEFDLINHSVQDNLPAWECSTGPLALADWDGDGLLDLFVGGRAIRGRYPEEPFSLLLRGTGTNFFLDRAATKEIVHAGLVSGTVFSDLDGDGLPELVLACDWGPVRVFRREDNQWRERTQALGLGKYLGWWNGVATGDFDSDGRMDIAASNWGRNTRYESFRAQPLRLYYGDWLGNDTVQGLEAYYDGSLGKCVPSCGFAVAKSLHWVLEAFPTQTSFGAASIDETLGDRMKTAKVLKATWLDTTIFLNRGDHFEAKALPIEAQFSPAFGISIGDLDGDGNEDLFLSQNFFAVDGDTPRYDAGRAYASLETATGLSTVARAAERRHGLRRAEGLCSLRLRCRRPG